MQMISRLLRRGLKTAVSDLKRGDWVEHNGQIFSVHSLTSTHSGRGSRSFNLAIKDLMSDNIVALKPTPKDFFEVIETHDVAAQFLYESDGFLQMLNPKTFEEISVPVGLIDPNARLLLEAGGVNLKVRVYQDRPILVIAPRTLKCTVAKVLEQRICDDGKRPCVVQTLGGARVVCPLSFVENDQILVNWEDMSFAGRG